MIKLIMAVAIALATIQAQEMVSWVATTGDVSLISAASAATVQQPSSAAATAYIDKIVVYCSVACIITQTANGTAATATAGSLTPIQPSPINAVIPLTFWTSSNLSGGTAQAGAIHVPAGGTVVLCLSPSCGNQSQVLLNTGLGTGANYTASIASISGTVNITFYGRSPK